MLKEDLKNEKIKLTNNEIKARNTYSPANESKGRTTIATTRAESDAMNKALNNPSSGKRVSGITMSDSKGGYYAKDGWVKMEVKIQGGKGQVHYIYNTKTGEATDFKYADAE